MSVPRPIRAAAFYLLVAGIVVESVFPFYYAAITSFKSGQAIFRVDYWPSSFSLDNYVAVLGAGHFARNILNSLIVAVATVALSLALGLTASFALARIRFRGANVIFVAVVVAMLLPPQITAVPLYVMWVKAGMTGTLLPLILPNLLGDAFSIFLLRQFFLTIPREYSDAARVDGASEWGILWRVIIPMARPGIAAAALFLFFNSWNDFYGPLLYTSENQEWWPVAYGLATFRGSHSTNWSLTMAITMLVMIPVVLIFFFAQRVFVEGITLTGVKG